MKFSRSHHEAWFECPRMRFLNYHYGGTGIVAKGNDTALVGGSYTHALLEAALRAPLNSATDTINSVPVPEGLEESDKHLFQSLFVAWRRVRLPVLLTQYDIFAVEQEVEVPLDRYPYSPILMNRIDGILRDKDTGALVPLEFKTTSVNRADYYAAFAYDTQIQSHLFCLSRLYPSDTISSYVQMEFLYKGYQREGWSTSPLSTCYLNPNTQAISTKWGYGLTKTRVIDLAASGLPLAANKPDWMPTSVWWTAHVLDHSECADQLAWMEIQRNEALLEVWLRQTSEIESFIGERLSHCGMDTFPARLNRHCFANRYNRKCPYLPICYGQIDLPSDEALDSAPSDQTQLYVRREPHHPGEFDCDVPNGTKTD